mgnify:CR=1 FL=1
MPQHVVEVDFFCGQTVFFRLDDLQSPGLVTGISISPNGVCYRVIWPDRQETNHYAFELSVDPVYGDRP